MPRRPRLQYPGAIYHVMSRGNRKSAIFDDDDDRQRFLDIVAYASHWYTTIVYALCLMSNHYHFVLETPLGNLSAAMQYINGEYCKASNRRHKRSGHVFEARFRSILVQRESYLRRVCRYAVLNPVRARLVSDAASWRWSTFRGTAGLQEPPSWLQTDWIEWAFRAQTRHEAQEKYRAYVNNPVAKRTRINMHALALGNKAFKDAIDAETRADRPLLSPRSALALARPSLSDVFAEIDVRHAGRVHGIYTAHVTHGYALAEIGRFLKVDRTTVSKAFHKAQANGMKQRRFRFTSDPNSAIYDLDPVSD
jgi:putative transposase